MPIQSGRGTRIIAHRGDNNLIKIIPPDLAKDYVLQEGEKDVGGSGS